MVNHPNRSKASAYTPPIPGQVVALPKTKKPKTREDAIVAAINSGKGLRTAAELVGDADELGFSDEHLASLIDLLKVQAESRDKLTRALMTHVGMREIARLGMEGLADE
jgi:hypothetical protein